MKARLVISAVAALISGVFGAQLVTKEGDPSEALQDVERRMNAALQPQALFASPIPANTSLKTYEVAAPDGRHLEIQFDRMPTEDDLQKIFAQVQPAGRPLAPPEGLGGRLGKITQTTPTWADVERIWSSLTWSNQQVAKAKAMMRWPSKPTDFESYAWERRSAIAAQPWQVEERRSLLTKKVLFATGSAVSGFLLVLLILALLTWSWRFLLARIRELSDAIRGK